MKKRVILIGIIFLVGWVFVFSALNDSRELYIQAVSEKDPEVKIQLLKRYEQEYGEKKDEYIKFIHIQLADTFFKTGNYDEAVRYGEKALGNEELAPTNKLLIFYVLAFSYQASQKDLSRAYDYAGSMIDLAQWAIDKAKNSDLEKEQLEEFVETYQTYYIATGYRIQAKILFSRGKDNADTLKEALQKALAAYRQDKSGGSAGMVFSLAGQLFTKNMLDDAAAAVENIFDENHPNERFANFLGTLYYKKGSKDKAVRYFELAYKTGRRLNTAMAIGKLVYKKDIDKGIKYFADAYVLSDFDEGSNAFKYLQQLYYNQKAKDLPPGEKEKGFKEIIKEARDRMGTGSAGAGEKAAAIN
jgi:tetratricopeptide (TPR) repeat protein